MFKKRYLIIFLFLIIAISAVSAVSAENSTATDEVLGEDAAIIEDANEEILASEETDEDSLVSEEIADDESPEILAGAETADEEILAINEDKNVITSEKVTEEHPVLTADNTKPVLSEYDRTKILKIRFIKTTGKYANDKKVYIKVTDANTGKPINKAVVWYDIYKNGEKETFDTVTTNSKGVAIITFSGTTWNIGKFVIEASLFNGDALEKRYHANIYCDDAVLRNVKIIKNKVKIKPKKLTAFYKSGKKFKVRVLDKHNKPVPYVGIKIKVYTGKKVKTRTFYTNKKGIALYTQASRLPAGKHKVKISIHDKQFSGKTVSGKYIKIQKRVKITAKSKAAKIGGMLTVYVKDKVTKKLTNGITVKLKIRGVSKALKLVTGYDSDSKKKGAVIVATNALSVGTHKVKVTINTDKYKGSGTTKLVIPKSSKNYKPWAAILTHGKAYFKTA